MPQNIYYIPIETAITQMTSIVRPLERRWLFGLDWQKSPGWLAAQLRLRGSPSGSVPYHDAVALLHEAGGKRGVAEVRAAWRGLKFLPQA